jgi:hypothetical protein
MYAQTQHIWNRDDLKEIVEWVNIYLLSISIVNNMYLVSPIVASEHYTSWMKGFFYYWYCHVCLTPFGIWYHHLLQMNTNHCVWYVSFTTGIIMSSLSLRSSVILLLPLLGIWYHHLLHTNMVHCVWCFFYYWYCHVVSLLEVFGITICCTRTWHIVYNRFPLLLVLSCRLSPLGSWYHHLLHTNTAHCVW